MVRPNRGDAEIARRAGMTELTIEIDRKHQAVRSGERWALRQKQSDGIWDTIEFWQGGRRSLFQRLEELHIVPTREAEAALALIPESDGFKERT